jgi:adenosylmethionine---8-amino-7-oxononanoate aminotransferase
MPNRSNIWHPFTPLASTAHELKVLSANGALLHLDNGQTLIDCISSWWVITHGHCHPAIQQAVSKQMATLDHVLFAGFTHQPAQELVELLSPKMPFVNPWFYFSDNGSTAVEVALKLSWQYWKNKNENKKTILAFEGAYHGDTFGSMSVSGKSIFNAPFSDLLFDVKHVAIPQADTETYLKNWEQLCAQKNAAAFIYEPLVQGAGGMRMYDAGILNRMLEIAKTYDIVCIADEVMTGFGRTGSFFASDQMQIKPDIICLSKGLTGGVLPLGLTVINPEITSKFLDAPAEKTFYHGHSFTGNPVACAAACANIKLFTSEKFTAIKNIEKAHASFVRVVSKHAAVETARHTGTILAIELKTEKTGYTSELRDKIYSYFIKKGLLIRPLGNVIYVLPPYCISENQLQNVYNTIEEFLNGEI